MYILTRLFESLSVVMLFSFPDVSILSSVTGGKKARFKKLGFIVCLVISSNGITDDHFSLVILSKENGTFLSIIIIFFLLLFLLSLFFLLLLLFREKREG